MRNLSTVPGIPGPRPWHGDGPKPHIPTVGTKTFGHYRDELVTHRISLHDNGIGQWTIAIEDPATEWWGAVLSHGTGCVRWFVGDSDGVREHRTTLEWPWDTIDTVRHVMTWNVFKNANINGTLGEYWY